MTKDEFTFRYRIRNWPEYNRALVKRGELTLWFDEEAIAGRSKVYADATIQCAIVLKSVFHLSLRSTQGFLSSLVERLVLDLPVPDYTTVSRLCLPKTRVSDEHRSWMLFIQSPHHLVQRQVFDQECLAGAGDKFDGTGAEGHEEQEQTEYAGGVCPCGPVT